VNSKGKKPRSVDEVKPRPRTRSRPIPKLNVRPATVEDLLRWVADFTEERPRPACVVLAGKPHERRAFMAQFASTQFAAFQQGALDEISGPTTLTWLSEGLAKNVTARVCQARLPLDCRDAMPPWFPPEPAVWELLWGLVAREDLLVDEPLRSMLDQDFFLIYDVYRALWEARFLAKENVNLGPAQDFVKTMTRWMTSLLTPEDEKRLQAIGITRTISADQRLDVLCFLLTLASQNALLSRVIFFIDGLERATENDKPVLRELFRFLAAIERWVAIGPCPVGVVIGHTAEHDDLHTLREIDDRLACKVIDGLSWVRQDKRRDR
jgi:hypothetical protein